MHEISSFTGKNHFLSNFHVESDGLTAEHRFHAEKTFNAEERQDVLDAPDPNAAKKRGRTVTLRTDWELVKDAIMFRILWEKFRDQELRAALLATGSDFLTEGNFWHDNYWGQCSCATHKGLGQNRLGYTLMSVRSQIFLYNAGGMQQ